MSYTMFIDDIRDAKKYYPDLDMVVVRDYYSACDYVNQNGLPVFVSFDHDLGDTSVDEKTGYSFAKFLIDYMFEHNIQEPFEYYVHSSNPVGRENIENYLNNGFRSLREE